MRGYSGLKNVRLKANSTIKSGDNLRLICDYDLENALLYSIKWYFGNDEFYRFVPKESPPTRVFPVPGISVDLSESDNKLVTLRSVQRDQTGYYKCEVSADAPLFHTDIKSALIIVVEIPESGPTIFTEKTKYPETELISAICTAGRAHPAANFTWYINGQKLKTICTGLKAKLGGSSTIAMLLSKKRNCLHVTEHGDLLLFLSKFEPNVNKIVENLQVLNITSTDMTIEFTVFSDNSDGMETSRSKLDIPVASNPRLFLDGKLKLRCEAYQFDVYANSVETEIVDYMPQLAHVLSPTPSNNSVTPLPVTELMFICLLIIRLYSTKSR